MGDKALGHEGSITTLTGTGAPAVTLTFNWGQSTVYPLVDVSPSGSSRLGGRTYQQSLRSGDGVFFDVMLDTAGSGQLGLAAGVIPSGTLAFVGTAYSGATWSANIILESVQHQNLTMNGDVKQFFRYRGKWQGGTQITAAG